MTHTKLMFGSTRPKSNHLSFLQKMFCILLIPLSFNAQAQLLSGDLANCPLSHPANTNDNPNGLETIQLGPDTNGDGLADYLEINAATGQQDADGSIYDFRSVCNTLTSEPVVAGASYGFYLNAGNTYTFEMCSLDSEVYPVMDAWGSITEYNSALPATAILAAASTSTLNTDGSICSSFTYTSTQTCDTDVLYLNVLTQNHGNACEGDWEDWSLNVTCSTCTFSFSSGNNPVIINAETAGVSMLNSCQAGTFTVPVPSLSSECPQNNLYFDAGSILNDEGVNVTYNGVPLSYTTGSGFFIGAISSPNELVVSGGLAVNNYNVTWSTTNCNAEKITANQEIIVQPVMACLAGVNIPMPFEGTSCGLELTPGMLLSTVCASTDSYTITIDGNPTNIISEAGTYAVQIEYTPATGPSGLKCWGYVNYEDKAPPSCTSTFENKYAPCNIGIDDLFDMPTFTDCTGMGDTTFLDRVIGGCGDIGDAAEPNPAFFDDTTTAGLYEGVAAPYLGFVIDHVQARVWTPTDTNGMTGESCTQYVYIFRPTESLIKVPEEIILDCALGVAAAHPDNLEPHQVPFFEFDYNSDGVLDSIPVEHVCKMAATYVDTDSIPISCGTQFKIVRQWTVFDWCAIDAGGNTDGIVFQDRLQRIKFMDTSAPNFDPICNLIENDIDGNSNSSGMAISPDTLETNQNNCFATHTFSAPKLQDACSVLEYSLEIVDTVSNEIVVQSNNPLESFNIQRGIYYVNYYVENPCNQMRDTCTKYFRVDDNQGPIVACRAATVSVADATDGLTQVCVHNVINDADTDDNCSNVTYKMRRMDDTTAEYTECISLTCADIGETMVFVKACDASGNESVPCMTSVTLQDKEGVCQCRNTVPSTFVVNPSLNFPLDATGSFQLNENNIFPTIPPTYSVAISETTTTFGETIDYSCTDTVTNRVFVEYSDAVSTITCWEDIDLLDNNMPNLNCDLLFRDNNNNVSTISNLGTNGIFKLNPTTVLANTFGANTWADVPLSDNCTPIETLISNLVFETTVNGVPVSGNEITLEVLGQTSIDYIINVSTTDNSGNNSGACPFTVTLCESGCSLLIQGRVASEEASTISNVEVELLGSNNDMIMTDEEGYFEFEAASDVDYTVKLSKNTAYLNGVSTFDLVKLSQHILAIETLDSPYKIIAGDANMDNKLSTLDLVLLRQLILFQVEELSNTPSWRFVDGNYVFPNTSNPWKEVFPENYFIQGASDDMNLNFVGVKVGDVDCSAQANAQTVADDRSKDVLTLQMNNEVVHAGEEYRVILSAPAVHTVQGVQFTLAFDRDKAELVEIMNNTTSLMQTTDLGTRFTDEGMITASWINDQVGEPSIAPFMILKMKATQSGTLEEVFQLNSRYTKAEAYNTNDEIMDLELVFGNETDPTAAMDFQLFQNKPNPFRGHTTIGFYLPTAQAATLTIYDISGKNIQQIEQDYTKGYNEIILKKEDLINGVLYYQLDTEGFSQTRKMIVLE